MTDINYRGKRINLPKEVWIDSWSLWRCAEECVCVAINEGLFRTKEEIETIGKLLEFLARKDGDK